MVRADDVVTILAGARYREFLVEPLSHVVRRVDIPMQGLAIGKQLRWLRANKLGDNLHQDLLRDLYAILDEAERRQGGQLTLSQCDGSMNWSDRGVYFFFEPGEDRTDSGTGTRVVRVGTHAVSKGSKATLWQRLKQHMGTRDGGGNHRGSVFRLIIGSALMQRNGTTLDSWGVGGNASREIRDTEISHERLVSQYIGRMPFVVVEIDDEPSPQSMRSYVERNTIALLSNHPQSTSSPFDLPSEHWLGQYCPREDVRASGLWNSRHVRESCDVKFLEILSDHVRRSEQVV